MRQFRDPSVFIGSSVESINIAKALQSNLKRKSWCKIWDKVFPASGTTIDSLIGASSTFDFAIFVFSDDDILEIRKKPVSSPRDNVIFEAGLFMGELGKDRVYIVIPDDVKDFHLLTDLSGFNTVSFDSKRAKIVDETVASLEPAADEINHSMTKSNWSTLKLDITHKAIFNNSPGINYPLKLEFRISNTNSTSVTIESISFELNPALRFAPNTGKEFFKPTFQTIKQNREHKYKNEITIEKNSSVQSCWIPIDPLIGEIELIKAIAEGKIGTWKYRCVWLKEHVIVCNYEETF